MNPKPIFIVMAIYKPNIAFLKIQVDSIIAQTHRNWLCLVVDDSPEADQAVVTLLTDTRFVYRKNAERLGHYRNFESGLHSIPADCDYIAFSDQDDEWHSNKLETMLESFADKDVLMVHSDLDAIDANGKQICASVWRKEKRFICWASPYSLTIMNMVTGCSVMIRRSLLQYALPFPAQIGKPLLLHDGWLALMASSIGKLTAINRPLISYRQHSNNVVGMQQRRWLKNPMKILTLIRYTSQASTWVADRLEEHSLENRFAANFRRYGNGHFAIPLFHRANHEMPYLERLWTTMWAMLLGCGRLIESGRAWISMQHRRETN